MNILFLTNSAVSRPLSDWLQSEAQEEVHIQEGKIDPECIYSLRPDLVISYNYRYLITPVVLHCLSRPPINLHISYLPWNRGADPNVWSFLEQTPVGVTIHHIDAGIDTGEILLQQRVVIDEASETLQSSYLQLHREIRALFTNNWPALRDQTIVPALQTGRGSLHYSKQFAAIRHLLEPEGWNIPIREVRRRYEHYLTD